jgi:hypothetical protein
MTRRILVATIGMFALTAHVPARAQALKDPIPRPIPVSDIAVRLTPVATGLQAPIYLTTSGRGGGEKYVVDQTGLVLVLKGDGVEPTPLLDITSVISQLSPAFPGAPEGLNPGYDERGLLGLAFHPGFNDGNSPGFRTLYTLHNVPVTKAADFPEPPFPAPGQTPNCQEVIAEWKVARGGDGRGRGHGAVDPDSYREILRFDRPQFNHNGGTIAFGPDGLLYGAFGDGGNANDVGPGHNPATGNAQDLTTILGKMIRIDPLSPRLSRSGELSANGQYRIPRDNPFLRNPAAVKEIYAYGFRNPFRFSFDADGGRLVLGDVGQNNIEEVDVVVRGGNYGWHFKEGAFPFNPADGTVSAPAGPTPGLIDPVVEYDHFEATANAVTRIAIVGGFVYRGQQIPELEGKYVCADLNGILFVADLKTGRLEQLIPSVGMFVKGIGQDAHNELYVMGSAKEGPSGNVGVVARLQSARVGRRRGDGDGR